MGTRHVQNKTQIEKVKAGIKASAVVLPLLGITWLFGLLAFSSETIAFKYIFAIANSLQGLAIFIFHCLLNKQVRKWRNFLGCRSLRSGQLLFPFSCSLETGIFAYASKLLLFSFFAIYEGIFFFIAYGSGNFTTILRVLLLGRIRILLTNYAIND